MKPRKTVKETNNKAECWFWQRRAGHKLNNPMILSHNLLSL